MRNVARDLPRVVHLSMATVVSLFTCVNLAYIVVLPRAVVSASNTVALVRLPPLPPGAWRTPADPLARRLWRGTKDFGAATLGTAGAVVFSVLVATSCFGALNGSTITTSMLVVQAGREGWLPAVFGEVWAGGRAGWAMRPSLLVPRTFSLPRNADVIGTVRVLPPTVLQAALTIAYILFGGGFRALINFFSVANWLFYFLTGESLLPLPSSQADG